MALPDSYTLKPGAIPAYFDSIINAQPPERFTVKFMENLGFTSTNDRLFIGVLKELGFLTNDGVPQQRYFEFLDKSQAPKVLAAGIREAYSDLFAINRAANELPAEEVRNKLRTLYAGKKKDSVIERVATTFRALCEQADFSAAQQAASLQPEVPKPDEKLVDLSAAKPKPDEDASLPPAKLKVGSLQYHINIVLPETRDQGVYDAIFKSLRDHLG